MKNLFNRLSTVWLLVPEKVEGNCIQEAQNNGFRQFRNTVKKWISPSAVFNNRKDFNPARTKKKTL